MSDRDFSGELEADLLDLLQRGPRSATFLATSLHHARALITSTLMDLQASGRVTPEIDAGQMPGEVRWRLVPARPVLTMRMCRTVPTPVATRPPEDPAWWVGLPRDRFSDAARAEMEKRQIRSTRRG